MLEVECVQGQRMHLRQVAKAGLSAHDSGLAHRVGPRLVNTALYQPWARTLYRLCEPHDDALQTGEQGRLRIVLERRISNEDTEGCWLEGQTVGIPLQR